MEGMDYAMELLANPPLSSQELQEESPSALGPLTLARCSRLGSTLGLRRFQGAEELREAALLLACGGHPCLRLLGGFGDSQSAWGEARVRARGWARVRARVRARARARSAPNSSLPPAPSLQAA